MEQPELSRLRFSRRGYKSHISRLYHKIDEIMSATDVDELQATSLETYINLLKKKRDTVSNIDSQIISGTAEEELEEAIMESEEFMDDIEDRIRRAERFLELHTRQLTPSVSCPAISSETPLDTSRSNQSRTLVAPSQSNQSQTPVDISQPHQSETIVDALQLNENSTNNEDDELIEATEEVQLNTDRSPQPTTTEPPNPVIQTDATNQTHSTFQFQHVSRLPKLTLPCFSGDPLCWQTFWDAFNAAINQNPSLSGIQKLNYLRAQVQGDAARSIAGLQLTEANYSNSVALLMDRYGQPHKLKDAHMRALLNIRNPSDKLSSLREFYDTIETHVRSLSSLGQDSDTYGALLVSIILQKLPSTIICNLARENVTMEWTLADLRKALLKEITIREVSLNTYTTATSPSVEMTTQPSSVTASFYTSAVNRHKTFTNKLDRQITCVYCKGPHSSLKCDIVTEYQARLNIIKSAGLCYNCLGHHKVTNCTSKFRCRKCKSKHHTTLCKPEPTVQQASNRNQPVTEPPKQNTHVTFTPATSTADRTSITVPSTCLLKTALAPVTANEITVNASILFDEGSQRSFISKDMATKLQLQPTATETLNVASFGNPEASTQTLDLITINVVTVTGETLPVSALVVPIIAAPLQNFYKPSVESFPHLSGLQLANPIGSQQDFTISLLIGADHYWAFIQDHIVRGNGPTAQQSRLGYLLSGPMLQQPSNLTTTLLTMTATEPQVDCNLYRFWELESTAIAQTPEPASSFLTSYQNRYITREADGHYTASFPWKEYDCPELPTNYQICKSRTVAMIRRLSRSPELLQVYNSIIIEQEKRGFVEKIPDATPIQGSHYLPHHPVKKASSTTPIRIVYDCSCSAGRRRASLNDCLMVGPPFLNDLCSILLRFRSHKFALCADLEKAFLHVGLDPSDRDYTRFLWLSDANNPESDIITYRFKVVPFGTASSPFMLFAVIDLHLKKFNSLIAEDVKRNLYVDNILSGCDSEEKVIEYYHQSRAMLREAKFNLRSWSSNSHRLRTLTSVEGSSDSQSTVNTLGLNWNTVTDILSFATKTIAPRNHLLVTKREILQASSQIYDPFGFLMPVTVRAKIILQDIWKRHFEWDEPLDEDIRDKWKVIAADIQQAANSITMPRAYHSFPVSESKQHLYIFCDASQKAYGAVAYLHIGPHICWTMARSRVAPVKPITLPKLELMAAVVATRLARFICDSLSCVYNILSIKFWSDSQIVLHWLHNEKTSNQFVIHRIQEITAFQPATTWSYVQSNENPADLLTRGVTTEQLLSSTLWTHGPQWLNNPSQWPRWSPSQTTHVHLTEFNTEPTDSPAADQTTGIHKVMDISRYSSLNKLLIVTTFVLRFIQKIKCPNSTFSAAPTANELTIAQNTWIRSCQQSVYDDIFTSLSTKRSKPPTLVRQLRLYLDKDNIIRCSGRIHNAPLSNDTKFPILLPPSHRLTELICVMVHKKLHHGGVGVVTTTLRQHYWIPTIRQFVRKILRHCVTCRRFCGAPYRAPDSPPLQKVRVSVTLPFTVTGVDFTGALFVRDNASAVEHKVYICLFTCAATRAIHLEIVGDLSVSTFLLAFRRFSCRRSLPRQMISDNASTYLAAAEQIEQLLKSSTLQEKLAQQGVSWSFIPSRAPWYGGFWERLIGLTKLAVKKTLGRTFVTLPVLETVVVEVESMLNNRPLTYISTDPTDPEPLTPSHFLYGRSITSLPHVNNSEQSDPDYNVNVISPSTMRLMHQRHAQILEHFWSRWKSEYLTALREQHKASGSQACKISEGDIVTVHDDQPRGKWKLAVVEKLIFGNDGKTRAARIRTDNCITTRPIVKLYPLEVSETTSDTDTILSQEETATPTTSDTSSNLSEITNTSQATSARPQRKAAKHAMAKMSEWSRVLAAPPGECQETQ